MGDIKGRQANFCYRNGVQGVVKTIEETAASGTDIFRADEPENNTLYVAKGHAKVQFTNIPRTPSGDYNFKIVFQETGGFIGTFAGNFILSYNGPDEEYEDIGIKLDNPDFDITDGYTVIHLHVWYDGINYCGKIDGYV